MQTGLITDAKAAEFRKKVHPLIAVSHIVEYVVISLGVLCIVAAVVLFLTASSKKRGRLELKTQARKKHFLLYVHQGLKVYLVPQGPGFRKGVGNGATSSYTGVKTFKTLFCNCNVSRLVIRNNGYFVKCESFTEPVHARDPPLCSVHERKDNICINIESKFGTPTYLPFPGELVFHSEKPKYFPSNHITKYC